jgi:hypothetical protein
MKYKKQDYINFNPFDGDRDVDIRCRTVSIVKTRKEHVCHISLIDGKTHNIKIGEMARVEKAICDGHWGSYYCCIPCMDDWFYEIGLPEDDQ